MLFPLELTGAAVNVNVVPLTAYAVVGSCLTFSTKTATPLVVAALDNVKATVLPSQLNVSLVTDAKLLAGLFPKYGILCYLHN